MWMLLIKGGNPVHWGADYDDEQENRNRLECIKLILAHDTSLMADDYLECARWVYEYESLVNDHGNEGEFKPIFDSEEEYRQCYDLLISRMGG
jgi:hypothetical protein